jgi:hypothetical protein
MPVILCTNSSLCSPKASFNYVFGNKVATARALRISIIYSHISVQTSLLTQAAMIYPLGAGNIVVSTISPLAAIVSLGLRLRARHSSVGSWFIEDYMIILALVGIEDGIHFMFSYLTFKVVFDQLCDYQYLR